MNAHDWSYNEVARALVDCGYVESRQKGSHHTFTKTGCRAITVNKDINKMVWRRLIKENGLDVNWRSAKGGRR